MQELISAGVGVVLSLVFSFIPPVATWYYGIDKKFRGLVMVGFTALTALGIFGLSCTGMFDWVACTKAGAIDLVKAFLIILGTNQLTYMATPESPTKIAIQSSAMHVSVEPLEK
jgi:hypothetical protein